jgi:hypothetical protein
MSQEPIQNKLCRGLEAEGHRRDLNARTGKYRVYIDSKNGERRYFVGKAGALRWGRTVTESSKCHDRTRVRILDAANAT